MYEANVWPSKVVASVGQPIPDFHSAATRCVPWRSDSNGITLYGGRDEADESPVNARVERDSTILRIVIFFMVYLQSNPKCWICESLRVWTGAVRMRAGGTSYARGGFGRCDCKTSKSSCLTTNFFCVHRQAGIRTDEANTCGMADRVVPGN